VVYFIRGYRRADIEAVNVAVINSCREATNKAIYKNFIKKEKKKKNNVRGAARY
jgi:hypothetical protein